MTRGITAYTIWPDTDSVHSGANPPLKVEVLRYIPVFDAFSVRYPSGNTRWVSTDHVFTKPDAHIGKSLAGIREHRLDKNDVPLSHPDCKPTTYRELLERAPVESTSSTVEAVAGCLMDVDEYVREEHENVELERCRVDCIYNNSDALRSYYVNVLYVDDRAVAITSYASKYGGGYEIFDEALYEAALDMVRPFLDSRRRAVSLDDDGERFRYIAGRDILRGGDGEGDD